MKSQRGTDTQYSQLWRQNLADAEQSGREETNDWSCISASQ